MLYEFNDLLLLDHRGWWFVWETAWDSFRPIDGLAWDGTRFVLDDRRYCADPTDPLYGYGSDVMKDLCELLGDARHDLPVEADWVPLGTPEWFVDRPAVLTPCAPRDRVSWKRMAQDHQRTCRKAPKGKTFTRRAWN